MTILPEVLEGLEGESPWERRPQAAREKAQPGLLAYVSADFSEPLVAGGRHRGDGRGASSKIPLDVGFWRGHTWAISDGRSGTGIVGAR
jgi:hypothetical protein